MDEVEFTDAEADMAELVASYQKYEDDPAEEEE
jgi:hypothetical protein